MKYVIPTLFAAALVFGMSVAVPAQAAESQVIPVKVKLGEPAPSCEARVTKKRIVSGGTTTLVWSSKHADKMYGITKGGVWEEDGRRKIAIGFPGKQVFNMVFIGEGGIATCQATVFVKPKKADEK